MLLKTNHIPALFMMLVMIAGINTSVYAQTFFQNRVDSIYRIADSLLIRAEQYDKDENWVNLMEHVVSQYLSIPDYKAAFPHAILAYKVADDLGHLETIARIALNIGSIYEYFSSHDNAIKYYVKGISYYESINDTTGFLRSYSNIILAYGMFGMFIELSDLIIKLNLLYDFYIQSNNKRFAIFVGRLLIPAYQHLCRESLKNNEAHLANIYYDRIVSYSEQIMNIYRRAYSDHDKDANFAGELIRLSVIYDRINLCRNKPLMPTYNNPLLLRNITILNEDHGSKAYELLLEAQKILTESDKPTSLSWLYRSLGEYFENQGDYQSIVIGNSNHSYYDSAKIYYAKSYELIVQLGYPHGIGFDSKALGRILGKSCDLDSARSMFDIAIEKFSEIGYLDGLESALEEMYMMYSECEEHKLALESYKQLITVRDSIMNLAVNLNIQENLIQYETEKKERENIELRLENERRTNLGILLSKQKEIAELNLRNEESNRLIAEGIIRQREDSIEYLQTKKANQQTLTRQEQELREAEQLLYEKALAQKNLILLALSGAVLLIGIIIYLEYRVRRRRLQQNLREVEEKALRAQLKPHFVFNAVASIQSFIHGKPKLADQYLTKFSHFTQEVLQNSEKQSIPLSDELSMLRKYMDIQNLRLKYPFQYEIALGEGVDAEDVMVPPAIFQPLVENSINHNFSGKSNSGRILISVARENGILKCVVEDACEGRRQLVTVEQSSGSPDRKSFGLQIVSDRLALWAKKKLAGSFLELQPHEHGMRVLLGIPQ